MLAKSYSLFRESQIFHPIFQRDNKKIVQSNLGNIGNETFMNTLVEQAFVIYRYGASVFLHGEPCLAMLLFGSIVFLRGLLCSFVCIHSLRC